MARIRIIENKSNQRKVTRRVRKGERSFLHATQCLYLIHIAMKFHPDIPYGAHKDSLKHQREVTQKLRKGEQ